MYQIDGATAAPTMPTPLAPSGPGYFTGGDPSAGVPATKVSRDFLNMVMMELVNLVVAGGLAPSKTTFNQVLTAIGTLFGISGNIAAHGHLQFNVNVLGTRKSAVINWGSDTLAGNNGGQRVTYDQPLSAAAAVTLASNAAAGPPVAFHGTDLGDTNGFNVWSATSAGAAPGAGTAFRWISIGLG